MLRRRDKRVRDQLMRDAWLNIRRSLRYLARSGTIYMRDFSSWPYTTGFSKVARCHQLPSWAEQLTVSLLGPLHAGTYFTRSLLVHRKMPLLAALLGSSSVYWQGSHVWLQGLRRLPVLSFWILFMVSLQAGSNKLSASISTEWKHKSVGSFQHYVMFWLDLLYKVSL